MQASIYQIFIIFITSECIFKNCNNTNVFIVGKPKSFFIQACRGTSSQDGVEIDGIEPTVPADADIFRFYATTPGKLSLKNKIFTDLLI